MNESLAIEDIKTIDLAIDVNNVSSKKSKKSDLSGDSELLTDTEKLLKELDIEKPKYEIQPDILHQIISLKRKYIQSLDQTILAFNKGEYLDLLMRFMMTHQLSLVHQELPLGFPTDLENVKYAFHFSFPVQATILLQNGFRKNFVFKKSIIALLIDPPVSADMKLRNPHANEGDYFCHWMQHKDNKCPKISRLEQLCRDFDITLLMDVYSESLADAVLKSSSFDPYLEQ